MAPDRDIEQAVAVLRAGGLVAFPTETVYGLGADASNPAAVRKIFEVKGRPATHPLIVHLADAVQLANWAREVPEHARRLARSFWPGPLTVILKRAPGVSDVVTGGQDTVALRVPSHPLALQLLARFGGGIAAPSAHRHGRVSATTAEHVRREFGAAVDCVLDGGETEIGIESAIVDLSGVRPVLLRPGWITAAEIESVLGVPLAPPNAGTPRAPGTLAAHYAPRTPLWLLEGDLALEFAASLARQGKRAAVLACSSSRPRLPGIEWLAAPADAAAYGHALYSNLRRLDAAGCDAIIVETPPQGPEWAAIHDRLSRAAAGSSPPDAP
ncbi:MAG TPA: L-threonylcarbamoyladenylate synthase [Burkholderiales bacterium]|nr:L-threonylcarbamoyladenylate synthase [Burkholderiales bacterium]